ncbi:hypothetical protein RSAG8_11397, partial [Rhizoctonia solani AG-8 WAC10335]
MFIHTAGQLPWMLPNEWVNKMGGERCDGDCSSCAASEFDLVRKLGQEKADEVFAEHWATWFTEKDVDTIAAAGLNTVRIPLGYWIIEDLVDRKTEFYPRGGLKYLKKGLRMLKQKGIHVLLDFHAMPGVAAPQQMFAGRCTTDVQFYADKNYERALTWAAIMTNMTHQDPDFSTVFAIEAVNEPVMDASKTPGYGDYQKRFVKVVREVENRLGIQCSGDDPITTIPNPTTTDPDDIVIKRVLEKSSSIMKNIVDRHGPHSCPPSSGIKFPITFDEGEIGAIHQGHGAGRHHGYNANECLRGGRLHTFKTDCTSWIWLGGTQRPQAPPPPPRHLGHADQGCGPQLLDDCDWQYNNPPNPADAANGPQLYDAHLYFAYGGVADPNAESYMRAICNTDRVKNAYDENNNPLVFGEWSLATNFGNSDEFLYDCEL